MKSSGARRQPQVGGYSPAGSGYAPAGGEKS
jgi:hypothetical protein